VNTGGQMTKSELIERLADKLSHLSAKDVEQSIKEILEMMAQTLSKGERIEIRGFGSFSLHFRAPRVGRNPKTGESVELEGKYVPHFKPPPAISVAWNVMFGRASSQRDDASKYTLTGTTTRRG
jgi:integration host factor subunit beta